MNEVNYSGAAGAQRTQPPSAPPTETLLNRLEQINLILAGCEELLRQVSGKIHGDLANDSNKVAETPRGVNVWIMDINARSQRIRTSVEDLNNFLG